MKINLNIAYKVFLGWIITLVVVGGTTALLTAQGIYAPSEFNEAEQLLEVRVDDTTLMFVSLYADNDAMERASAARTKRMDLNKDLIESMEGKTGEVILNHK